MARLYTQRLLGGHSAASYSATVPDGFIWVIRDVSAFWDGDSDPGVEFYNLTLVTFGVPLMYGQPSGTAPQFAPHWQGRQVVEEGEVLEWASTTATWFVAVTGYALSLP